jgi:hypothetical protein
MSARNTAIDRRARKSVKVKVVKWPTVISTF